MRSNTKKLLIALLGPFALTACSSSPVRILEDPARAVNSVTFTSAGDSIVTAGIDGGVRVLTVRDGQVIQKLGGHSGPVWGVSVSPRGDVASASNGGELWLSSLRGGDHLAVEGASGVVRAVAFASTGDIGVGTDGGVGMVRMANRPPTLAAHGDWKEWVYSVAFSPRGDLIVAGCGDGVGRIYGARNGKLIAQLVGHKEPIYGVAFSPTEAVVATACLDGKVRLWSATDGMFLKELDAHKDAALCVAFSSDGSAVISGGRDGVVRFFARKDGTLLRELVHGSEVRTLAISPRGDLIATAGGGSSIKLWKAKD
jgi:WD40 repeat protein